MSGPPGNRFFCSHTRAVGLIRFISQARGWATDERCVVCILVGPKLPFLTPLSVLQLDLASHGLASEWNKRAATLFAHSFVDSKQFSCQNVQLVTKAFRSHLITLRDHYQKQLAKTAINVHPPTLEMNDKKKGKARDNRRREVSPTLNFMINANHASDCLALPPPAKHLRYL